MNGYWRHKTAIGEARIVRRGKYWQAEIGEEGLGSYTRPENALDDLTHGATFSHSSGVDTSTIGLPDELGEWEFVRLSA